MEIINYVNSDTVIDWSDYNIWISPITGFTHYVKKKYPKKEKLKLTVEIIEMEKDE